MVFYGTQVTDGKITWLDASPDKTIHLTNACLVTPAKKKNGRVVLQICDQDSDDSDDDKPQQISLGVLRSVTADNVRLDILINSRMGLRLAGDSAGAVVDVVGNEYQPDEDDPHIVHDEEMEFSANLADVARMLDGGNVVFASESDSEDDDDDGDSDVNMDDHQANDATSQGRSRASTKNAAGGASESEKGRVIVRGKSNGLPIINHKSGLKFQDLVIGSGKRVIKGHNVALHYTLRLENGKVVDKADRRRPFKFRLGIGECIKGFDIGVSGMREGGERHLIVPPQLGYGHDSPPGIPRNSTLFFDVGVIKAF